MGSIAVGSLIARLAFPTLLVLGWLRGELRVTNAAAFVVPAAAAYVLLPRLTAGGNALVTSVLAVLDIALVFIVFKGDIRIT